MTKAVRIENADANSTFGVTVEVWITDDEGTPIAKLSTSDLRYPATMTEIGIHDHKVLIVREYPIKH